jgi:hypothetical protein
VIALDLLQRLAVPADEGTLHCGFVREPVGQDPIPIQDRLVVLARGVDAGDEVLIRVVSGPVRGKRTEQPDRDRQREGEQQ